MNRKRGLSVLVLLAMLLGMFSAAAFTGGEDGEDAAAPVEVSELFEPVTIDEPATETEAVEEEAPAPPEDETEAVLPEEVPESSEIKEIGEVTIEAEVSEPGETPDETGLEPDVEAFVNEPVTLAALDGAGEAVKYKDGTYTGSARCEPDKDEDFAAYTVTVTVTIAEGRISKIEPKIGDDADEDNDAYFNKAANGTKTKVGIVAQMLADPTAEIDAVSNATCSSAAIRAAVADALAKAVVEEEEDTFSGYVLMNIPYSAFYAAEGVGGVDAVSSATFNKTRTATLAGGSYHVNSDGSDITGVVYPVYVEDMSLLADYTRLTDESSVTIRVTNRGTTTETTYTGKDALFEAPSYAYYVLSEDENPALYKTLNADGTFSAINAAASTVAGVTGEVTVGGRHANIEIVLSGTEGIDSSTQASGVVLTDSEGNKYGLRHVVNIWRGTELGWNFGEYDLAGKTITNIRYITRSAVVDYPVEIAVPKTVYAVMNVPYSDFYGQIIGDANGAEIDAFSSATPKKAPYFWDSSYKGNTPVAYGEGQTLKGVQFPVLITEDDLAKLSDLTSAENYYCAPLDAAPALFVKATVGEDGAVTFAKLSARATTLTDATATITSDTKHGDYLIEVDNDGGVLTQADKATFQVYGAVLATAERTYPVRHLANLYYKDFNQISFFTTPDESGKGQRDDAYAFYAALEGQTITSITFYTSGGVYLVNTALHVGPLYVLMNIPYSVFYAAQGAAIGDVDAVSSATNKTGNYGKAGGAYHSGTTASVDGETVTAVGGANGSQVKGVIWPVRAESLDDAAALGGTLITDESAVTTATLGRGASSYQTLVGYETLTEAPAYSYYILDEAPASYLVLSGGSFAANVNAAVTEQKLEADVSYGTNWGDVQLDLSNAEAASDKLINAIALTTKDGKIVGLYHLDQIWSYSDVGWKVAVTAGLDGTTITNVRYYCSVKDADLTDGEVPAYANLVYDYPVELAIAQVYTGTVTAKFADADTIEITGLPADVQNPTAMAYYTTGSGRNAVKNYLTKTVLDESDGDLNPVPVALVDGKLTLDTAAEDGMTVTVELSSDNYIIRKATATYTAAQSDDPTTPDKPDTPSTPDTPDTPVTPAARTRLDADDKLVVTDALKAAGKTEDSIKTELKNEVLRGQIGYTAANVEVMELSARISRDGGLTWAAPEAEDFPLTITIPYPDTAKDPAQYDYRVAHMFAEGERAGQIELLDAKETADGLEVTVSSLSPFAIAWKASAANDTNTANNTTNNTNTTNSSGSTKSSPKTGDDNSLALWLGVLVLCSVGTAALVVRSKKGRHES